MDNKEYKGAELIGPFISHEDYILAYEGKRLPHVKAHYMMDAGVKNLYLCVDGRMSFGPFTENEVIRFTGVLANAMANAAGYPCHGAEKKKNDFNVEIIGISLPPNLTSIDGGKKDD